jgi:hypothetical protein
MIPHCLKAAVNFFSSLRIEHCDTDHINQGLYSAFDTTKISPKTQSTHPSSPRSKLAAASPPYQDSTPKLPAHPNG